MFDLLKELENFSPFDEQEMDNVSKVREFLLKNKNCFDRNNLAGHVTAGAFVCDKKGNILLNHHKKSNRWFQFGGHSDGDTDSLNVAKREVMEECGIEEFELASNLIFDVDVQVIYANETKNEPEHLHYDINFLFVVKTNQYPKSSCIKSTSISPAMGFCQSTERARQMRSGLLQS